MFCLMYNINSSKIEGLYNGATYAQVYKDGCDYQKNKNKL